LATEIEDNLVINRLPSAIYERSIANLKISVGSEIVMKKAHFAVAIFASANGPGSYVLHANKKKSVRVIRTIP
jgi:hypothetical protein